MADEPDNAVLVLLREVRAKLDEHDQRFARLDDQLVGIGRQLDDIDLQLTHAMGLAAGAAGRSRAAMDGAGKANARLDELFARVEALESR